MSENVQFLEVRFSIYLNGHVFIMRYTCPKVPFSHIVVPFISQVWTEEASGHGATNFITGMGGYLQSILFGYGGLRMHIDRIDFNCIPIPDTTGFTIRGKFISYTGRATLFISPCKRGNYCGNNILKNVRFGKIENNFI